MKPTIEAALLGELKYEIDSLYVSTEIIESGKYRQPPFDGLLLGVCLLHFRVVWDFFYGRQQGSDLTVRTFLSDAALRTRRPKQPKRLAEIRLWLNVMLAHLSSERIDPKRKAGEISMEDIGLIRSHTEALFLGFAKALSADQKAGLVNPHARKFQRFKTLAGVASFEFGGSVLGIRQTGESSPPVRNRSRRLWTLASARPGTPTRPVSS